MSVICVVIRSQIKKCLQILVKILSANFHKNPSNWNHAVGCVQPDRHSDGQKDRPRVGKTYGQPECWNLDSRSNFSVALQIALQSFGKVRASRFEILTVELMNSLVS